MGSQGLAPHSIDVQEEHPTVVLVDDSDFLLTAMESLFSTASIVTVCFSNGPAALEWFSENYQKVDVVLLDMRLPGMSGPEIFEKMKCIDPEVKVAVHSGEFNPEVQTMLDRGALRFLEKPINYTETIAWIEEESGIASASKH
ncbi:MAG: response regulator [Bdellovibrionales bacterium]|nr:response regulator [Bdellovibrionales bacterium]